MRTIAMFLTLCVTVAGGATVFTRQATDFTGTWVATKEVPATVGAAPSAVFGDSFAMRQQGGTVTLLRPVRGRATAVTTVHPLDGSEVRVMSPSRPCFGQTGQLITIAWERDALRYTIAGTIPAGGGAPVRGNFGYTFRKLTPETLVIETTMRDSATAPPRAVGTVYRRSTDTLTAEPAPAPPVAPATIAQVSWLSGDWIGGTAPTSIEERWSPGNGGAMIAMSRTVRGDVMTEFEFLCIAERNGTLVYTAMPNAGAATDFTLTKIDAESATFENPEHNFPKMIRYARRPDGSMEAVISGAPPSRPIAFVFRRK
jgi:Domain of unknown function (DUF6265)